MFAKKLNLLRKGGLKRVPGNRVVDCALFSVRVPFHKQRTLTTSFLLSGLNLLLLLVFNSGLFYIKNICAHKISETIVCCANV